MNKFYIEIDRNTDDIKKILPKFAFYPYMALTAPIYDVVIKKLAPKALQKYNPKIEGNRAYFEQEDEDIEILNAELKKVENFLYSDFSRFKDDERYKKIMSNRWTRYVLFKLNTAMEQKGQMIGLLLATGITVKYGIQSQNI